MAAPARPPMSAWEDEVGRPPHQVRRSQIMAPASAAMITYCVTCLGSTRPLLMVLATARPIPNAARKLNTAAHTTAHRGESTRVETTVAMLLAASWKPLMKSNESAIRMVTATNNPLRCTWLASLFLYVASLQPALRVFQGCTSFSLDVSGSASRRPRRVSLLEISPPSKPLY